MQIRLALCQVSVPCRIGKRISADFVDVLANLPDNLSPPQYILTI